MTAISRRRFLGATAAAGAGLVIGFYLPRHGLSGHEGESLSPNAYLHIGQDGMITIVVPRSEMGQGVRTALPMILAEELDADWPQIAIEQAGASTLFGDQTTGGSASVRTTWDPMRQAGAAAREMLIAAAAQKWGVSPSECQTEKGVVLHPGSKRTLGYGELVGRAARLPVPKEPRLKGVSEYRLVGTRAPRVETPSKTNGSAEFGIDFRMAGMKYALLVRCPTIGGKVASFDDAGARKIPGVAGVEKISDSAVAVVASSVWAALQGRKVLRVAWDDGPNQDLNTARIVESLRNAIGDTSASLYKAGEVSTAKGRRIQASYETPMLAHAPMEPENCFAHFLGSSCQLWSPTQVPQDVRDSVAAAVGLKPENVRVNVTLMGGGFGRRLEHDYAVEAALVSKAVDAPVQVMWTREDDMRFSTYRPPSLHQLSAVVDSQGWPMAFSHRLVSPSISGQKGQPGEGGIDPDLKDEASFLYLVPNIQVDYVAPTVAVPLGWMRSVYAAQVAFASESFLDELAVAAGKDPLAYRLHLLAEDREIPFFDTKWRTDRLRGVLQLAADRAGWTRPLPAGRYRGIAAFGCFGSYAAEVVEITMQESEPQVERVVAAVDCGQVVNPNILEQQIYSAVIFGLSSALRGKITIERGQVQQSNFDTYPIMRMNEIPSIEACFVSSHEPPTGIGEPPVPPLAPALCNAIFAATKKRIRALPVLDR